MKSLFTIRLVSQTVFRVSYAHSTLGQLSFHTRLVIWLRFLQKTVGYHGFHGKTKLTTANIKTHVSSCSFVYILKMGGKTFSVFFKLLSNESQQMYSPYISESVVIRIKA